MKTETLRGMTPEELQQKLHDAQESLFNLKFQHVTKQLENTAQLTKTRRTVARIQTILREKSQNPAA